MTNNESYLVADVGGTNTRLAVGDAAGRLSSLQTFRNDELRELPAVLAEAARAAGELHGAVVAVAGPAESEDVRLTNRDWSFSRAELARALGLDRLLVVNDFVAMAHSVPALGKSDLVPVGPGVADSKSNILVCGPGTGFGVAVLVRHKEEVVSIATEAGHMRLGAVSAEEYELFARLASGRERLAVEDVLSGGGLAALHRTMTGVESSAETLIAAALEGDGKASATVSAFMEVFGRVVGDLALAFDARGGIYIGGGLGAALSAQFSQPPFRHAFEAHPPYEMRLGAIPLFVISHPYPGLVGALQIANAEFGRPC